MDKELAILIQDNPTAQHILGFWYRGLITYEEALRFLIVVLVEQNRQLEKLLIEAYEQPHRVEFHIPYIERAE
jgi:hypothetical protein